MSITVAVSAAAAAAAADSGSSSSSPNGPPQTVVRRKAQPNGIVPAYGSTAGRLDEDDASIVLAERHEQVTMNFVLFFFPPIQDGDRATRRRGRRRPERK